MIEVGRLCVKLAGRDAGRTCVVVDVVDERTVLIDGDVRRRNCNLNHLEPLTEKVDLKKGASHSDVEAAFKKLDLTAWSTKPKKAGDRPRRVRKVKVKIAPEAAVPPEPAAKPIAKEAPKTEPKPAPKKEVKTEPKATPVPKAEPKKSKPVEKKKVSDFGAE